jgi:Mrp family chromosome partitioning ATPase
VEGLRVLGIIEEGRALSVEENLKKTEIVSELKRSTFMEEVGSKNIGSCGSRRVTHAQSFFT